MLNNTEPVVEPAQEAYLPSAGYDYRFSTRHTFVREERVDLATLKYANKPRSDRSATALIYVCEETKVERRWGLK